MFLALFLALILTLTFFRPPALLFSYWIPLIVSYASIMFFAIPEHNGCNPVNGSGGLARSTTSNALIRFFMWQGNYHAEHHLFPAASADSLKKIAQEAYHQIYYHEKSYLKWHFRLFYHLLFKKSATGIQNCQN